MSAGLQVWDSDGRMVLDTTVLVGRIFGHTIMLENQANGVVTHPGLSSGTPFAFPLMPFIPERGFGVTAAATLPRFSFSGNTMTWTRGAVDSGGGVENLPRGIIYFGAY